MPPSYLDWNIRPLWLNHAPGIYTHHQHYLAALSGGLVVAEPQPL